MYDKATNTSRTFQSLLGNPQPLAAMQPFKNVEVQYLHNPLAPEPTSNLPHKDSVPGHTSKTQRKPSYLKKYRRNLPPLEPWISLLKLPNFGTFQYFQHLSKRNFSPPQNLFGRPIKRIAVGDKCQLQRVSQHRIYESTACSSRTISIVSLRGVLLVENPFLEQSTGR